MDSQRGSMDEHHDHQNWNQLRRDNTNILSSSPPDERVLNATIPQAWGKAPPNTGRKIAYRAPLARSVPSPSHSARMRKIFQNASTSLHSSKHISGSPSSPYRLRIPRVTPPSWQESDIKNTYANEIAERPPEENHFTFTDQLPSPMLLHPVVSPNGTRWTTVPMADEPISSGFHSPSFPNLTNTQRLANSQYLNRSKPKRVPLPPHQTGSSPLGLDETKLAQRFQNTSISDVQSWLDGLYDEPSSDKHEYDDSPSVSRMKRGESNFVYSFPESQLANGHHYTSRLGSDKENMSPSSSTIVIRFPNQPSSPADKDSDYPVSMKSSLSASTRARRSKFPVPSTPVLVRKPQKCYTSPRSQGRGQISPTLPRGHFMLPPRRKKIRSSSSSPPQRSSPAYDLIQPFEIAEDEESNIPEKRPLRAVCQQTLAGLRDLSPHVTPFRKGQGPKRSRCPSYYDEDLLRETRPEGEKRISSKSPIMNEDGGRVPLEEMQGI
ncbi:hypothetical protein GX50_02355 [[Emmonsia] crescens]|uniref:Uncharacterized protein n=1 Tax=[Emmonsia] crescens TaxID=73230 RepID=A0A2B7ZLE2_9EURO|nr:hypothetical protein GX50_02355 [Emmonsia crescens]